MKPLILILILILTAGRSLTSVKKTSAISKLIFSFASSGDSCHLPMNLQGLDKALRRKNYRDRDAAYRRSELSLIEFGKAVVAHKEDFSRHNPIDRWWGGTRLTNDRLWRWDPVLVAP